MQSRSAPAITATAGLSPAGVAVIIDDDGGVGQELGDRLARGGQQVLRLSREAQPKDSQDAARLAERLREQGGVAALVDLAALGDPQPEYGGLPALLLLAQALRGELETAAAAGGAAMLGATRLGGGFGVGGDAPAGSAPQAAQAGFLKTAALEWPDVRVKSVDLSQSSPARSAEQLLAELMAADGLVEVGYRDGVRTQLAVVPSTLQERPAVEVLDSDSVVLVTGGARGITARAALMLAERHRPTLVLVGRTPDEPESAATAGLSEGSELREAMIEARRREQRPLTPALVEKDCRRILQAREVGENLARLRQAGASVEYLICDVSDDRAFAELIDSVYERHGRIDGVLHGAGIIEDKLIADKQVDSLERVIATKAGAARTLAARLRPAGLRFLVFFSSVSGRFGNPGQADYAAASEVLGRLAHELDRSWPGRVVSIDWGPWRSAGMVSAWLEQEFARRGVALIGLDQGCRMLYEELARGRKTEAEVVIGAATGLAAVDGDRQDADLGSSAEPLPLLAGAPRDPSDGGALQARYTLDLARHRYLEDHRIDGRPVLPFAVAMELMAEFAVTAAPGRTVGGLRKIRLLDGVALEGDRSRTLHLDALPQGGPDEIEVTIGPEQGGRPHYRATVELRDSAGGGDHAAAEEARESPAAIGDARPFPTSIEEAYRDLLFHGPLFQGISAIDGLDERGASALLSASRPGECVAGADGLRVAARPGAARQRAPGPGAVGEASVGCDPAAGRDRRLHVAWRGDRGGTCAPRAADTPRDPAAAVPRRPLVLRGRRPSAGAAPRCRRRRRRRPSTDSPERSHERTVRRAGHRDHGDGLPVPGGPGPRCLLAQHLAARSTRPRTLHRRHGTPRSTTTPSSPTRTAPTSSGAATSARWRPSTRSSTASRRSRWEGSPTSGWPCRWRGTRSPTRGDSSSR